MIVTVVGAGCAGRTMVLSLLRNFSNIQLNLLDENPLSSKLSCGYAAAGMVAPYSEAATLGESKLYLDGLKSLKLWPLLLEQLESPERIFKQNGTLVLAHPNDQSDFQYFSRQLSSCIECNSNDYLVAPIELEKVEKSLPVNKFHRESIHFDREACIQVPEFYKATTTYFQSHPNVHIRQQKINEIHPKNFNESDFIIDCRGMGKSYFDESIRGLRGESIVVYAPDVDIKHTIRLIHPRYPIYITPRSNNIYYIGATTVENTDSSEISVKSTMELLSALYVVHPGFSESRILKLISQVRPATQSGYPEVNWENNVVSINGLNRHGYLLSPVICNQVCAGIKEKESLHEY
ncbi:FAD-binding oxidoreductase [Francisellaceae bacterium]|nr:FAD-binding oxidoreductase [Francisellaceae bacterium]